MQFRCLPLDRITEEQIRFLASLLVLPFYDSGVAMLFGLHYQVVIAADFFPFLFPLNNSVQLPGRHLIALRFGQATS